ncbi:hypothetical protein MSAN_02344700 [Mycena sanguinolenta]|uniref:Protein YOP1 n=1 Tax=Mycena sanguinolenta TaxID=230812 RepID=A0A8H6X6X8_9AGAR|nr:hypothetical protein MSAN_02344700 [Mycena sanguinolenta]
MALIVPILRLVMLLLNMYDTFKVLKLPRPSARNSGQPTIRALSQRKRNMKGCLAVWIVWCCFMIYERMAEKIVSLFVPFYDEFKSLVLLFLIFTRARGAEPIFLHILRPLLKPYTSTLDALSDIARMFGDLAFLMLTYPFHLVSSWWHSAFAHRNPAVEDETNGNVYIEVQQAFHSVSYPIPAQGGGRRRSSGPIRADAPVLDRMVAEQNVAPPPYVATENNAQLPRRVSAHEIWHPPRSAYHDEDEDLDHGSAGPPLESLEARMQEQMEEWRQYPPFPSAYPPTPLSTSSSQLPVHDTSSALRQFSTIPEDPPLAEQDFGQSLLSPHELPNSGSASDLSDEENDSGIQNDPLDAVSQDDTMDEDDEEDDFNVTLRTPGSGFPEAPDTVRVPMTRSRTKASTATIVPIVPLVPMPSLLSRISSETLSVSSDSSSGSLLGQKRSRDLAPSDEMAPGRRGRIVSQPISSHTTLVSLETTENESSAASSSSADDGEVDGDKSVSEPQSPLMKKRRVASAPSRVQPRRTTRSASREPPAAPPPTRRRRQPRPQAPDVSTDASETTSRRADVESDGIAPRVASTRRAGGGGHRDGQEVINSFYLCNNITPHLYPLCIHLQLYTRTCQLLALYIIFWLQVRSESFSLGWKRCVIRWN